MSETQIFIPLPNFILSLTAEDIHLFPLKNGIIARELKESGLVFGPSPTFPLFQLQYTYPSHISTCSCLYLPSAVQPYHVYMVLADSTVLILAALISKFRTFLPKRPE